MKNTKKKLKSEHKTLIIKMLGAYYSPKEIVVFIKEEYSIKISRANIVYYKKHYREEIREARKHFLEDIEFLPVSDKAYRILLRQKLVDELMDNLWINHYSGKNGQYTHKTGNHLIVNKILDSIREELEPKGSALPDTDKRDERIEEIIRKGKELAMKYCKNLN